MICVLMTKETLTKKEKMPYNYRSRNENSVSTNSGTLEIVVNNQKLAERCETRFSSERLERTDLADILISDFLPPKVFF